MLKYQSCTYTRELDAAVAALGGSAALLDVQNTELAAGSLDNPRQVRRGVVTAKQKKLPKLAQFLLFTPSWLSVNNSRVATTVGDSGGGHGCGVVTVVMVSVGSITVCLVGEF